MLSKYGRFSATGYVSHITKIVFWVHDRLRTIIYPIGSVGQESWENSKKNRVLSIEINLIFEWLHTKPKWKDRIAITLQLQVLDSKSDWWNPRCPQRSTVSLQHQHSQGVSPPCPALRSTASLEVRIVYFFHREFSRDINIKFNISFYGQNTHTRCRNGSSFLITQSILSRVESQEFKRRIRKISRKGIERSTTKSTVLQIIRHLLKIFTWI